MVLKSANKINERYISVRLSWFQNALLIMINSARYKYALREHETSIFLLLFCPFASVQVCYQTNSCLIFQKQKVSEQPAIYTVLILTFQLPFHSSVTSLSWFWQNIYWHEYFSLIFVSFWILIFGIYDHHNKRIQEIGFKGGIVPASARVTFLAPLVS